MHLTDNLPRISLVIPAWNESALLPRLLETVETARQQYRGGPEQIEVIVADNSSTDDTAAIAEGRGHRVVSVARRCIAAARNGGAAVASGELVAFADADFRIDRETFNFISQVMARPGIVGGATGLTMERWSVGIRATWYLIMPPLWLLGLDGGVWFCRRCDFQAIGGYNEAVKAGEDVRFLTALKRLGRSRKPRERLVNRFLARTLGMTPPIVTNSTRKFDIHGDWHMFRDALFILPRLVFGRRVVEEYVDRYFYEGREGSTARAPTPNRTVG